jgi:rRNA maturation RNase YbeY
VDKRVVTRTELVQFASRRVNYWLKRFSIIPSLRQKGISPGSWVDVAIVSKKLSQELNEAYRGKAEPTDVLSFPTVEVFRTSGALGELVICAPIWLRQAMERKKSWKREGDVLIVHGLLHLLGFDHEADEEGRKVMLRWERKWLGRDAGLIERGQEPTMKRKWPLKRKKASPSRRTKSASR